MTTTFESLAQEWKNNPNAAGQEPYRIINICLTCYQRHDALVVEEGGRDRYYYEANGVAGTECPNRAKGANDEHDG